MNNSVKTRPQRRLKQAELDDAEVARDPRMQDLVVPDDCIWEKVARTTERDLGRELNHAMRVCP